MHTIRLPKDKALVGPLVMAGWLKKEGQPVSQTDSIAQIEAIGAQIELQASVAGTLLKILVQPGQVIEPDQPLCTIGEAKEQETANGRMGEWAKEVSGSISESTVAGLPKGVIPILMPQAGQTMEEGTLVAWKVKAGDRIAIGQVIFDIETDKATMEVEATDTGRVARIVAQEGQVVPVKTPVAFLAENDADVDAYLAGGQKPEEGKQESGVSETVGRSDGRTVGGGAATQEAGGRIKASPAARKLAAQKGVDLASMSGGSGPGGRIISTDVASAKAGVTPPQAGGLSKMRLAIARNLLWSKQNIPHFYAKRIVEAQALFVTYRKTKERFKCTVNDFVTAACAKAIREFPAFRSQFKDNAIVEFPSVNIGIAVGTDEGLTVPVVLNVDQMDLQTLSQKTRQVAENARAGKLEGVGQGIFTITNMGMFGIEEFLAIINPPESAILAVGAIREAIKIQDGAMLPTREMTLSLSVDHRVIDGVLSAQFLNRVKELLEKPEQLI
jgi:pyruvate dehydrogenase E2 component (dihydrolipoamide acetyltransferase)